MDYGQKLLNIILMKRSLMLSVVIAAVCIVGCAQPRSSDNQDPRKVGGECDECEAVFEYGWKILSWIDTLPDYSDDGPKMEVSGTIYRQDGKTPAAGVILYIYHTDQEGIYPTKGDETGWAKRHGYIRGWI